MTKLRDMFLEHGHIFVSRDGYVSIEIYSADVTACDYVAQEIGGTVKRHLSIRKVVVHNRPALVGASQKLLEVVYDDKAEEQLRLVLEYATANTKNVRDEAVGDLRELLKEGKK